MAIAAERLHRITAEVYERMGEAGLLPERGIELVDGLIVTMSPKGHRHGYSIMSLNEQLVDQRKGRYMVCPDSLSLRLGPRDMPDPDIALARVADDYSRRKLEPGDIALIIEVADSSLAYDLGEKRSKYAAAGIPEYWVVDLQANVFHVFRDPAGDGYGDRRTVTVGESVSPEEYPDVSIDVAQVVRRN